MPSWSKLSAVATLATTLFSTLDAADASRVKVAASLTNLYPRQSTLIDIGSLPASCKCQDFLSYLQDPMCGADYECICTNPGVMNDLKTCEKCVVDANMANQTVVDKNIAVLMSSCNTTGEPDWEDLNNSGSSTEIAVSSTAPPGAISTANISAGALRTHTNLFSLTLALALFLFVFF